MRPHLACFVLLSLLVAPPAARANLSGAAAVAGGPEAGQLCRAAVAAAEREAGLPPRLLSAMARVESGRRDPETGRFNPWPWTINAEGRGSFFPTKAAAIAGVQALQAQGVRSIDVGCMQINLRHHPNAFANLEEAFDPLSNARYAARFLSNLQATRSDWMLSAAHYHSQTPELAQAYRARIASAWEAEKVAPSQPAESPPAMLAGRQPQPPAPTVPQAQPSPPPLFAGAVVGLPAGAGRGLDAYRSVPIPVAGRGPALAAVAGAPSPAAARPAAPAAFAWLR